MTLAFKTKKKKPKKKKRKKVRKIKPPVNFQAFHTLIPRVKNFPALRSAYMLTLVLPNCRVSVEAKKSKTFPIRAGDGGAEGLFALPCWHSSCGRVSPLQTQSLQAAFAIPAFFPVKHWDPCCCHQCCRIVKYWRCKRDFFPAVYITRPR